MFEKLFRLSNIGTMIFFTLNFSLLLILFSPYSFTTEGFMTMLFIYVLSILFSCSFAGEKFLAILIGAKEIRRTDVKIKIIPLVEVVYNKAKKETPDIVGSIHLMVIPEDGVNAFTLGKRTICVTEGLLRLPDDLIMGALAHEIGHVANRHTEIQILIGGANLLISGFLLILKAVSWIIAGIAGIFTLRSRRLSTRCLFSLVGGLSLLITFGWIKFCNLFLMWSARQNEYVADEYAYKIGFGKELAVVLDRFRNQPIRGIIRALETTHPSTDERIARLQMLGVPYSRWSSNVYV